MLKEFFMAKIEAELYGNFDIILMDLHNTVMRGSTSASLEESSDIVAGSTRWPSVRMSVTAFSAMAG